MGGVCGPAVSREGHQGPVPETPSDAWGHTLSTLLASLPEPVRPEAALIDVAKALDKHYIPTRYPNGFERGAPTDFYTHDEAQRAIAQAESILDFCRDQIGR